jgi:hypothetical protein
VTDLLVVAGEGAGGDTELDFGAFARGGDGGGERGQGADRAAVSEGG